MKAVAVQVNREYRRHSGIGRIMIRRGKGAIAVIIDNSDTVDAEIAGDQISIIVTVKIHRINRVRIGAYFIKHRWCIDSFPVIDKNRDGVGVMIGHRQVDIAVIIKVTSGNRCRPCTGIVVNSRVEIIILRNGRYY